MILRREVMQREFYSKIVTFHKELNEFLIKIIQDKESWSIFLIYDSSERFFI